MGIFDIPLPPFDVTSATPDASAVATAPATIANYAAHVLIAIAIPIAVAAIMYSAYTLMTGQGKPEAYNKVKKNITYLLAGVALIIFAAFIFNFVAGFFRNGP